MTKVSVITPTWDRHAFLLDKCIPSVQAQNYQGGVEHVVVSDGPDLDLELQVKLRYPDVHWLALDEHDHEARWGHWARLAGIEASSGEYVTYLDDDDTYRPAHCDLLAKALDAAPGAGFAYSMMLMQGAVVGSDPPVYCQIGTPMIMHRRELLEVATWEQSMPSIDWDLVSRWLDAGVRYVHVPAVTIDVWPSVYR